MEQQEMEARIRTRAYQLWEMDASPEGRADEYWERAVRQLEAEGVIGESVTPPGLEQADKSREGEPIGGSG